MACANLVLSDDNERLTLPHQHWRERGFGRHVVVSSLDANGGQAGNGAYSSSKAAITRESAVLGRIIRSWTNNDADIGLIESFDQEVAPLGFIKNLIVEPGLFRTPFLSKIQFPEESSHYQWLADEARNELDESLSNIGRWKSSNWCGGSDVASSLLDLFGDISRRAEQAKGTEGVDVSELVNLGTKVAELLSEGREIREDSAGVAALLHWAGRNGAGEGNGSDN